VPVPATGTVPVKALASRTDVGVTVVWKNEAGTPLGVDFTVFEGNTVYKAAITLTAKSGYAFDPDIPFTYPEDAVTRQSSDRGGSVRIVNVTYKAADVPAPIGNINLTPYVPAPVRGGTPVTSFSTGNYSGTVAWKTGGNAAHSGLFQGGTAYTAAVTLVPATGYAFAASVAVTHSGASPSSVSFTGGDGAATGDIGFGATEPEPAGGSVTVLDYDLRHYVPVPVTGAVPVTEITSRADVEVTVVWKNAAEEILGRAFAVFEGNTVYRAVITLTAKTGYTFDPDIPFTYPEDAVTGQNSGMEGSERTVNVIYEKTAADPLVPIGNIDLMPYIPAPVTGGTPETSFFTGKCIGTVAWKTSSGAAHSGLFQGGTAYTAEVTLTAAAGFTLTGLGVITHTGGGTVTGYANQVVTITFPETAFLLSDVPFSGSRTAADSVIDLIRANVGRSSMTVILKGLFGPTEMVRFDAATDFGTKGLVLSAVEYGYAIFDGEYRRYTTNTKEYANDWVLTPELANSPANLVIDGGGRTVDLTGSWPTNEHPSPLITVGSGVTLTLRNITFKGMCQGDNLDTANTVAPLIDVSSGGTLVLETGAVITGNNNKSHLGGGVYVHSNGMLIREGGEISGNTAVGLGGGGVYVEQGTFTMNNGTVSGNTADGFGGGVYVQQGTFTMNNGKVSGNFSYFNGGGVYVIKEGTFTMNNGTVSGNTANYNGGGVYVEYYSPPVEMTGEEISGNTASGSTFTMSGGEISGNTASGSPNYGNGGGVYVSGGTFTMSGGTISGNTASGSSDYSNGGGGVYIDSSTSTFTKSGQSTIYGDTDTTHTKGSTENTAVSGIGHAVYVSYSERRNTTAGPDVDLDSTKDGAAEGWE
jgi:hypothetical protein